MAADLRKPDTEIDPRIAQRADLARLNLAAGKTVESVGTHYVRGGYWTTPGGHVGYIDWRGQYGGSRSDCGHAHQEEAAALACIQATLTAAGLDQGSVSAGDVRLVEL